MATRRKIDFKFIRMAKKEREDRMKEYRVNKEGKRVYDCECNQKSKEINKKISQVMLAVTFTFSVILNIGMAAFFVFPAFVTSEYDIILILILNMIVNVLSYILLLKQVIKMDKKGEL